MMKLMVKFPVIDSITYNKIEFFRNDTELMFLILFHDAIRSYETKYQKVKNLEFFYQM